MHRIVFVNEASPLIGMGHILRSQVLARMMYTRGYEISGLTIGDGKAVLYAQERSRDEHFEWRIQTVHNSSVAIEYILHYQPAIVVLDCTSASQDILNACTSSGLTTVALDYFSSDQPLPAAIINLIDHNQATIAGQPPARYGAAYYEGSQYAIIRDDFLLARKRRGIRKTEPSVKNILIAFGGADPAGNSQRALDMIIQWPGEFIVNLIIGPLFTAAIERWTYFEKDSCVLRTHSSPSHMGTLFEDADLVFCGGGGTLLEALCVGVPAIVIAQNDAELRHARSFAQRGACWLVDETDWEILSRVNNRKIRSESAQACVDGRGAERVCNVIAQQINLI